jgi:transaldolase
VPTPFTTKLFADGADLDSIVDLLADPRIAGFTTNPTLMRQAGLADYESFARALLEKVVALPVSLEVCADDPTEILRQARVISSWGDNVYVKVPVTTTSGLPLAEVGRELSQEGVKVNMTAVFTVAQVERLADALDGGAPSYISVFAGRIADAGIDPVPIVAEAVRQVQERSGSEIIWASPREVLNVVQANTVGCHIITLTPSLFAKLDCIGKDLDVFSLETVAMFHRDATESGLRI